MGLAEVYTVRMLFLVVCIAHWHSLKFVTGGVEGHSPPPSLPLPFPFPFPPFFPFPLLPLTSRPP